MMFNIEPTDSIDLPEPLQRTGEVVVGDLGGVLIGLGYPDRDGLRHLGASHPAVHNLLARFPGHVFVLAQKRLLVLNEKQASFLGMGLSAAAHGLPA